MAAYGLYGVSRSMFFYVKKQNVSLVPGIEDFISEFTQEDAWGPTGYLVEKGLIPLSEEERAKVRERTGTHRSGHLRSARRSGRSPRYAPP